MKKILIIVTLFLNSTIFFAQGKLLSIGLGEYRLSYYSTSYPVFFKVNDINKNNVSQGNVYIGIPAGKNANAYIVIEDKNIQEFKNQLILLREKLNNNNYITTRNHITTPIQISANIELDPLTLIWTDDKENNFSAENLKSKTFFEVFYGGGSAIGIEINFIPQDKTSEKNYYFNNNNLQIYFSNIDEINKLLAALEMTKIAEINKILELYK
ncbi:MAG: hypothetical protein LBV69_03005 [Bacteroidales bacterium]|jgi:hypothetical protein|nr:hypothetical protein [Bacteroidales bacterium]